MKNESELSCPLCQKMKLQSFQRGVAIPVLICQNCGTEFLKEKFDLFFQKTNLPKLWDCETEFENVPEFGLYFSCDFSGIWNGTKELKGSTMNGRKFLFGPVGYLPQGES